MNSIKQRILCFLVLPVVTAALFLVVACSSEERNVFDEMLDTGRASFELLDGAYLSQDPYAVDVAWPYVFYGDLVPGFHHESEEALYSFERFRQGASEFFRIKWDDYYRLEEDLYLIVHYVTVFNRNRNWLVVHVPEFGLVSTNGEPIWTRDPKHRIRFDNAYGENHISVDLAIEYFEGIGIDAADIGKMSYDIAPYFVGRYCSEVNPDSMFDSGHMGRFELRSRDWEGNVS